ncbi:MAG: D-alanyl-D-alanine carboxypeptidase [Lachnospiraceae bacterium]|jgi:D-alanyl-D-alanine carboxypeptidase (penicillin-binding protein 5/6)|nr:D-alanyl-D-alanine carboxypeptidase [Lachnospiraceae bacterium]
MKTSYEREERRRIRRVQRNREVWRRRRRRALIRRALLAGLGVILVGLLLFFFAGKIWKILTPSERSLADTGQKFWTETRNQRSRQASSENIEEENNSQSDEENSQSGQAHSYEATENTLQLGDEITSAHAVFVDTANQTILADKGSSNRMVPASMTKVLTLLVAVENITDFDDTFTITMDITDYSFRNGCSCAGFEKEETLTIWDLMYGTILPSGADAALGLAIYVSGSQEAFVELMNEKLEELGLSETAHFTNCVGIYDDNHYCTANDMAVIMEAAIQNEICREVLSARTYLTSRTEQHPEGILLSNWFMRRIEDKDTGGVLVSGKTGYVDESGSCAVSYGTDQRDRTYICVTADSVSKWGCINDHAMLYKQFSDLP